MNKKTKKIVFCIVGIVVVLLLGSLYQHFAYGAENSGVNQNGKVGTATEDNVEGKKPSENISAEGNSEGMYSGEISTEGTSTEAQERSIVTNTKYDSFDNRMYSWWFKRNDTHEPSGCTDEVNIEEYQGFYTFPTTEKVMYITFDCGYENGYTADILDTLKEEQVPAAFFVTQNYIRDNVDLVKRMKEEGHLVCNHTVSHPCMPEKSIAEQRDQILQIEEFMKEATGYEMDLFFRPPKGEYSERTLQLAKDLGYITVFWSMAYLDYDVNNQPTTSHVVEHFQKYHHPGAIPLLHNVSKANHDALPQILYNLKKEGYQFKTLYDLRTKCINQEKQTLQNE